MVSTAASTAAGSEDDTSSSDAEEDEAPGEEEEGIMYPRRVIVSPLRALPYTATPEVSNRILRRRAPLACYANYPQKI